MSMFNEAAQERTPNQKRKIIAALRQAGSDGVTNKHLSNIALRYTARMNELYDMGYEIKIDNLGNGVVRYILLSEPEEEKNLPTALELVQQVINERHNGKVNLDQFKSILEEFNIIVCHKGIVKYRKTL